MALSNYEIKLFSDQGNYLFNLENIIQIDANRLKNDSSEMVVRLPGELYDFDLFQCDLQAELWRHNSQLGVTQLQLQTNWFLRKAELTIEDSCEETLDLTFLNTTSLLERRVNANLGRTTATIPSHMLETSDDLVKLLFYFNFQDGVQGAGVAPAAGFPGIFEPNLGDVDFPVPTAVNTAYAGNVNDRQFNITSDAFFGLGGPIEVKSTFINVLNAMQTAAQSTLSINDENLWFDIVYTPASGNTIGSYHFKTWLGQRGVTRDLIVGPEYNNLTDATFTRDWNNEATIAYILGNGDNETRALGQATNDLQLGKPFYPIEIVGTANNTDTINALDTEAASLLQQSSPLEFFEGSLISTNGFQWAEDFEFGDVITASWKGVTFLAEITDVEISIDDSGEEISIPLTELVGQ